MKQDKSTKDCSEHKVSPKKTLSQLNLLNNAKTKLSFLPLWGIINNAGIDSKDEMEEEHFEG